MGSFMGKTKIYYEFKRKNVNCYSCPAYRATLRELLPTQMVTEPQNTPSFSVSGR
jgi:hypothetical protein